MYKNFMWCTCKDKWKVTNVLGWMASTRVANQHQSILYGYSGTIVATLLLLISDGLNICLKISVCCVYFYVEL